MSDQTKVVPLRELQRDKDIARHADKSTGKDSAETWPCDNGQLSQLADISPVQNGQRRGALAKELGTSLAFLDLEYRERRKRGNGQEAEEEVPFLRDPEAWLDPVDGADLRPPSNSEILIDELSDIVAARDIPDQETQDSESKRSKFTFMP
jgi:hypothetical protein